MDVIDFPIEPRRVTGAGTSGAGTAGASTAGASTAGASTARSNTGASFATIDPRAATTTCMHDRLAVGKLVLDLCPQTDEATWFDRADAIDPAEALASLFGGFDLEAALPAVLAPGETVLAYAPDSRRGRAAMRSLPANRWIEGAPGLWLTHDGVRLLMSPVDRLLAENLMRDL